MRIRWMLLAALALAAPALLAGQPGKAVVEELQGSVTVQRLQPDGSLGQPAGLGIGDEALPGDRLQTGADSSLVLTLDDGTHLELAQDSDITLKALDEAASGRTTLLSMAKGFFHAVVAKLEDGDRFELATPNAVAAVKGTEWDAEIKDGSTSVGVHEGTVWMGDGSGQASRVLAKGFIASAGPAGLGQARAWTEQERAARLAFLGGLRSRRLQYIQNHPRLRQQLKRWKARREAWRQAALKRRLAIRKHLSEAQVPRRRAQRQKARQQHAKEREALKKEPAPGEK
jgi:hypothetical protein